MNFMRCTGTAIVYSIALVLAGCTSFDPSRTPTVDDLRIDVHGTSRTIVAANGYGGFFLTETNAPHRDDRHGWFLGSRKILDDYVISVDGKDLLRPEVQLTQVFPHQFQRSYPTGVQETVTFLDSLHALVVELGTVRGTSVGFRPVLAASGEKGFQPGTANDILLAVLPGGPSGEPVWIAAGITGASSRAESTTKPAFLRTDVVEGSATAFLVAGGSQAEVLEQLNHVRSRVTALIARRKQRMQEFMDHTEFRTSDTRLEKAFHWAALSLDALVVRDRHEIAAGLPWNGRRNTREALRALAGARLVHGRFDETRDILRSLAQTQETMSNRTNYGQIPDPGSLQPFAPADVTPEFIEAVGEFVNFSGDTAFVSELFPVVRRAIDGTLQYRIDRSVLMTHPENGTWLEGLARGNRAAEIQSLWYKQLLISTWLAGVTDNEKSFREWFSYAEQVRLSFNRLFVDTARKRIYDHLRADGTPVSGITPGQFIAIDVIDDHTTQFNVFREATAHLVYPHGVGTMSQADPRFEPAPNVPYRGRVESWLSSPWVTMATRWGYADPAYIVTSSQIERILETGPVGTLEEYLSADLEPGSNQPRPGGHISHAGTLGGFIRNVYQDYLGVVVDAVENRLELTPHLPNSVSDVAFSIPMGGSTIRVRYHRSPGEGQIVLSSPAGAPTIDVITTWRLESGIEHNFAYLLPALTEAELTVKTDGIYVEDNSGERKLQMNIIRGFDPDSSVAPITLASPRTAPITKEPPPPR